MSGFRFKMNRYGRVRLENAFKGRQDRLRIERFERIGNGMADLARRLADEKYLPMQADMPVLAKYGLAAQCTSDDSVCVNFNVPVDGKAPARHWIYVKTDVTHLRVPWRGRAFAEPGRAYPEVDVADGTADHAACLEAYEAMTGQDARDKEEREAFAASIRATSSFRRVADAHPWMKEDAWLCEAFGYAEKGETA